MELKQIGANQTVVTLPDSNYTVNRQILFSYSTPVAYAETDQTGRHYYRTEEFYSKTTSKHINGWLPKHLANVEPQEFFDKLAA